MFSVTSWSAIHTSTTSRGGWWGTAHKSCSLNEQSSGTLYTPCTTRVSESVLNKSKIELRENWVSGSHTRSHVHINLLCAQTLLYTSQRGLCITGIYMNNICLTLKGTLTGTIDCSIVNCELIQLALLIVQNNTLAKPVSQLLQIIALTYLLLCRCFETYYCYTFTCKYI